MSNLVENTRYGRSQQVHELMEYLQANPIKLPSTMYCMQDVFLNCREQGVVFKVRQSGIVETYYVAIFEHRNSDTLCLLEWKSEGFSQENIAGGFRVEDLPGDLFPDSQTHTATFKYQDFAAVKDFLASWVERMRKDVK